MDKAPDAFRTISEVAEVLETPAHVLRFWESRFPQIKPVKRAGGRRYYRPADVALLSGIRQLLHTEGMTIRGVQKVLREQGVRHVAAMGGELGDLELDDALDLVAEEAAAPEPQQVVVKMTPAPRRPAPEVPGPSAAIETLFPLPVPEVADLPQHLDMFDDQDMPENLDVLEDLDSPEGLQRPEDLDQSDPEAPLRPAPATKPPATPEPVRPSADVPRDGEGGFIAFSHPRILRQKPVADPLQPSLPFEAEEAQTVEAPHVWVEPDPRPTASITALTAGPTVEADAKREDPPVNVAAEVPELAGVSARLRNLARPVSSQTAAALVEVHSRLGLLHAQMAEAQRLRRATV